jgi:membrane associated rhomboid family serine protease
VPQRSEPTVSEPIFNAPAVVIAVIAACVFVHVARTYFLSREEDVDFLINFAFIPARYDHELAVQLGIPEGWGADIWTFVTYAFIHGDIMHLGVNTVWLLPFGAAVARRIGSARFLAFFAVTAAAGALAHLFTHAGGEEPVIGASAAISGYMAAATRFAFQRGGPLGLIRGGDEGDYHVPAVPLRTALRDMRIVVFLVAWFGLNIVFGLGSIALAGSEQQAVAWQAHIGGFLAGLLLFPLFDPIVAAPVPAEREGSDGRDGNGGETPGSTPL